MPKITLENVTKRWGKFYAVDELNLEIEDNSFVTLLGPSGCGKTTILRMIAGLETPTSGKIAIGDKVVFDSEMGINVPPNKRKVGFLFQNYALWPNMTVYDNISFGLKNIKEELATIDFESKKLTSLINILKNPNELVSILKDSINKDGKLDTDRGAIRLIDRYQISIYTAKEVMDYNLHESNNVDAEAKKIISKLETELNEIKTKNKSSGIELNDKFEIIKNGQIVKTKRKMTKEEIDLIVRRVSRIVKISMFMNRYPSELSGGQQQRVAIARTLAPEPSVLFMDEPLSNLDAKLRLEMRSELQRLHFETGSTFVYVTHDQMEAMTLATKICLIDNGVLQQYDRPLTIYKKPNNLFVADFVGNPAINFINAIGKQAEDGNIALKILDEKINLNFQPNEPISLSDWIEKQTEDLKQEDFIKIQNSKRVEKENKDTMFKHNIAKVEEDDFPENEQTISYKDFVLAVRPEYIKITSSGILKGEVYSVMPTGMETTLKIRIGNYLFTSVAFGDVLYEIGESVNIDIESNGIMLFSRQSGKIISLGQVIIS